MTDPGTESPLAEIGVMLHSRIDHLSRRVLARVRAEVPFYRDSSMVSDDELRRSAVDNFTFVFRALQDNASFDTSSAANNGQARALAGIPRSAVMDAYRVGGHCAWEEMMALSVNHPDLDRDSLWAATALLWEAQVRFTDAMTNAYHETATHLVIENGPSGRPSPRRCCGVAPSGNTACGMLRRCCTCRSPAPTSSSPPRQPESANNRCRVLTPCCAASTCSPPGGYYPIC